MKLAFISDIHANLEALTVALADIRSRKIREIYCLGDVVNYGANPRDCLKHVREAANVMILGNHEAALVSDEVAETFNPYARDAIFWTREQFDPTEREDMAHWPFSYAGRDWVMVHGTLEEPGQFNYMYDAADAIRNFKIMKRPICFCGHTHVPALFSERTNQAMLLRAGKRALERSDRYIINVSSVGQPRDQDSRLGYLIFDEENYEIELVRLAYDVKEAAKKIREAGLPQFLADRLEVGR